MKTVFGNASSNPQINLLSFVAYLADLGFPNTNKKSFVKKVSDNIDVYDIII